MTCCGSCNKEPVLGDLLDDPIVALLMARDGNLAERVERFMDEFASVADEESHVEPVLQAIWERSWVTHWARASDDQI